MFMEAGSTLALRAPLRKPPAEVENALCMTQEEFHSFEAETPWGRHGALLTQVDEGAAEKLRGDRMENVENKGILFSSGLIAGEALMGVIIATIVLMGFDLHLVGVPAAWPGVLLFGYIAFLMGYMALREDIADHDWSTIKGVFGRIFRR